MELRIKEYRKRAGMNQKKFAELIGVSFRTVQSWEAGLSVPNAEAIWNAAVVLNTDPETLIGWDEHVQETTMTVSHDERLLIEDYRSCTPSRKAAISSMTRDMAGMSKLSKTASGRVDRAG